MAIADPSPSTAPSPKQLGRQLRQVRKQKGLSRSEVARSAGLTRRELAAYERGKVAVPESDLWCLAGSCGVDVGELLPNRDPLQITSDLSSLTVGNSIRHLRATQERDGVLREYLSMIYELRNLPPGSRVPLREADLATLADALGGTPDLIEQRLMELIGASREEAARLRAMILPPLSLPAVGETASADQYAAHPQTFDPAAAAEQFFSTPRAEDPFAKPPADDTLAPAPHIDAFLGGPATDPFAPADPFAALDPNDPFGIGESTPNPFAEATDLFAPPSGAPLSTAPPEADPFAALPSDLPTEDHGIANPFADLPEGMQLDDPLGTRGFAPDVRSSFADTGLTMDPFGAAFEPSVSPLDASDLLRRTDGTADSPGESGESATDSAAGEPGPIAHGWIEIDTDAAEATEETLAGDDREPTGEVAAAMVEAMVDPTVESPVDSPVDSPVEFGDSPVESPDAAGGEGEVHGTDADSFGPLESSPFGIAVPSIEDLLASSGDTAGAMGGFPAGDGWREAPAEPAYPEPEPDAYGETDEPPALDGPTETGGTTDAFAALRSAFGVAVPDLDEPGDPGEHSDEYGDPHTGLPEGMQVDLAFDGLVDPGEDSGLETLPGELAGDGIVVDAGFDPADEYGDEYRSASEYEHEDAYAAGAEPEFETFETSETSETFETSETSETSETFEIEETAETAATFEPFETVDADEPEHATPPATGVDSDDDLVPIAWTAHAPSEAAAEEPVEEVEPEPVLEFVTAGPDWHVGGIYPATAGADGTLSMRRADVRWALADVTADGDCTIEAAVHFTSGAGFGVLFRASLDDSERLTAYSFDIEPAYGGGSYLVRQWVDNHQHWQPLAQAPVEDTALLYGQRTLRLTLVDGELTVMVDDAVVLHVDEIDQASFDLGCEPCRGERLGVQAGSTTEVTVDTFRVARH
ncbi:MAG TPA: helix-turn-helix domain-containing protein [Acidimicrobiia bacterium]|nr:helix-turn-helix domain-containing protein [Acidimicrobiia bacterium]